MQLKPTVLSLVAMNCLLTLAASALAQAEDEPKNVDIEIQRVIPRPGDLAYWFAGGDAEQAVKPSSHWMGVVVRPTDPLLQKHLGIEGGLVIEEVTADSPAADAGMLADDILISINKTPVADMPALMAFLTENGEKEATVQLLREGKKKSLKVTPTERPADHARWFAKPGVGRFDFQEKTPEEIRAWIEEMAKAGGAAKPFKLDGEDGLKLRFFHPGVILGEGVDVDVDIDLPEGLRIAVIKQGDAPAKIQVKLGDKEWDVTEKELDQLPEDIRAHVKKYLGGNKGLTIRAEPPKVLQVKPLGGRRVVPRVQAHAIQLGSNKELEKKLDQINERLEKIEQALEKLAD